MANKKIWAYAVDETGEYVVGEKHPLKIYYIWETLKLRRDHIHQFNKLTFMSTHRASEKRLEMFAVITGFYRYKSAPDEYEKPEGDSDSLSHSIAIQALAEQSVLNFKCGNDEFTIEVDDIRSDDTKIQLTNRDTYEYYYPDLICQFRSPTTLATKWGNKLVLEVKHTHGCEDEKIFDFKNHCIPIIEINIAKWSIEKKYGTKSPTPEQLEDYYCFWKAVFAKQIFGRVLSNPVTPTYFVEFFKKTTDKLSQLDKQNDSLRSKLSGSQSHNTQLKNELNTTEQHVALLRDAVLTKESKIEKLEKRGLFDFLVRKLGFKRRYQV